jgi:hypothetical protein
VKRFAMVCALVFAGIAGSAQASLVGSGGEALTDPAAGTTLGAAVAVTPSGWTFVAWSRLDIASGARPHAFGAWRRPGGRFEVPWPLGRGQVGAVVATSDGRILVGWSDQGGNRALAKVTMLYPGDTSGEETVMSPHEAGAPVLAADAHGNAVAASQGDDGIQVATRSKGGSFGEPLHLPESDEVGGASLTANDAGDFAIVSPSSRSVAWVRPAGSSSFGQRELVPGGDPLIFAHVAMTSLGTLAVAGSRFIPTPTSVSSGGTLQVRPRGGVFGTPFALSDTGAGGVLVPSADGGLTVFDSANDNSIRTRELSATGALSAPTAFAPPGTYVDGAVTSGENTFVAADVNQPGAANVFGAVIALSERPAHGAFSPLVAISAPNAMGPSVAGNHAGALAVTWVQWVKIAGEVTQQVRVAVRDGAAELDPTTTTVPVTPGGVASIPVVCTGVKDCVGSVSLQRAKAGGARSARSRAVKVRRGQTQVLRLRVSSRRTKRAHLWIVLRGVRRVATTKSTSLRLVR